MKRAKKKRAGRKRSKRSVRNDLVQVVMTQPGQTYDEHCPCPLCAELAEAGEPVMVVDADGSERWVLPKRREMMTVRVSGDASTWPELQPEGNDMEVPVGCVLLDFLVYLSLKKERLPLVGPGGVLVASIDNGPFDPTRVLQPGDKIVISRIDSSLPELEQLMGARSWRFA